jgi:hypothetical protein
MYGLKSWVSWVTGLLTGIRFFNWITGRMGSQDEPIEFNCNEFFLLAHLSV